MRKASIVAVTIVALIVGGLWLFFNYGGKTPQAASNNIERVQDKRLSKGDADAPVKIVEYVDVLCQYCAKSHQEILPQLQADYIDKGLVHYEIRLVELISPDSKRAATGAYCAAEQGKFWEYIDLAYQRSWDEYYVQRKQASDIPFFTAAGIDVFARALPLDMLQWNDCTFSSGTYESVLAANLNDMHKMEATGTPTFLINGKSYNGLPPYPVIKALVGAAVKQGKS